MVDQAPILTVRGLSVRFLVPVVIPPTSRAPRDLPDVARALFTAVAPRARVVLSAVDELSFHVGSGEVFALVGEHGAGKSSTVRALCRLEPFARGEVSIEGVDVLRARGGLLRRLRRRVQPVLDDDLDPKRTLAQCFDDMVAALGFDAPGDRRLAETTLLLRCGLDASFLDVRAGELTRAQRVRASFARALIVEPRLIVVDEPVRSLDVATAADLMTSLLSAAASTGASLVFSTNDIGVAASYAARVGVLYAGRLVEVLTAVSLPHDALHPYTRALVAATPGADPKAVHPLSLAPGDVPDRLALPAGCTFHPRCGVAGARCRIEAPLLKIGGLGSPVACHAAHGEL